MAEPNSMYDFAGWREINCREADLIRRQGAGLSVGSSLTDPDGQYGRPVVFTEWWWGDEPVLRDRRTPGQGCRHFIATSPDAANREDDGPSRLPCGA